MMDNYYIFKLDEESEEQYKKRMGWLMNTDLCRTDVDKWLRGEHVERNYSQRCLNFIKLFR